MSLSRRALRLMTITIRWCTHDRTEPFFVPDFERISAIHAKTPNSSPHSLLEENHLETLLDRPEPEFCLLTPECKLCVPIPFPGCALGTCQQVRNTEVVKDTTTNVEEVSTVPLAVYKKALAEKDAVEQGIRREADPNGRYSRDTIDTAGLVKNIRKRHRDALRENEREKEKTRIEKETLRHMFEDAKEMFERIVCGQNEEMRSREKEKIQACDASVKLRTKYADWVAKAREKDGRIAELEKQAKEIRETCDKVKEGSVEALKRAYQKMEHRITCNKKQQEEKVNEMQDRLNIARRMQPVYIVYRGQAGTVCETRRKAGDFKEAKKKKLAAKDEEINGLRTTIEHHEREIRGLEVADLSDRENLKKYAKILKETRKTLSDAERKIRSHQREVTRLNRWGKEWENGYNQRCRETSDLRIEMDVMRGAHRSKIFEVEAQCEFQQSFIEGLKAINEKQDKELEAWKNGHGRGLRGSSLRNVSILLGSDAESLVKALKAANARADTLQLSFNALQAENGVLKKQLGNAANTYNPQVIEQVERLQSENHGLREAAEEAETLKTQLVAQFEDELQKLEESFAVRTRELEHGFDEGFENLRGLREQWLLSKRGLEEEHYRKTVAADLRCEIDRQSRDKHLMAIWKGKDEDLSLRENDLQSREANLAIQVRNFQSSSGMLTQIETRAQKAEEEVRRLQEAAVNNDVHQNSVQQKLYDEGESLRRDGERYLDLLNEETSKMAESSELPRLHDELQTANLCMKSFKFAVLNDSQDSKVLSEKLYGADFNNSDVRHLQDQGRPVLLAQLEAAKETLCKLRNILDESPEVEVDKALEIVLGPRGDERDDDDSDLFDQLG